MKRLLIAIIPLALSCATKQKSVLKETATSKTEVHQHAIQNDTASATAILKKKESVNYEKWLKIYPKEKFSISEKGFLGMADSVIWYANYQRQTNQSQQLNTTTASKNMLNTVDKEIKSQRQEFKKIEKSAFRWWPIMLLLTGLMLCCFLFKAMRSN